MRKEMLDLAPRDFRQISVVPDIGVALRELRYRHGDNLLVTATLVRHLEHADRPHGDDGTGNDRPGIGNEDVAGIAIFRTPMSGTIPICRKLRGARSSISLRITRTLKGANG